MVAIIHPIFMLKEAGRRHPVLTKMLKKARKCKCPENTHGCLASYHLEDHFPSTAIYQSIFLSKGNVAPYLPENGDCIATLNELVIQ